MYLLHLTLEVSYVNHAKVVQAIHSITGLTSVQPGCSKFGLYCDVDNDDALILVEEWESREALHKHIQSDDFRVILSLMDSAEKPPALAIHEVSSTAGLDFVEQLRKV